MTKAEYAREYRQARRETARLVISGKRKIRQEYIKVFSMIARVIRENKHKPFLEEQIRSAFPRKELFDFLMRFIMDGRRKAVKLTTDINKRYILEALQKVPGHGLSAEKIGKLFDGIAEKHKQGSESVSNPPEASPSVPLLNAKSHSHKKRPVRTCTCRHEHSVVRNARSRTYHGQSSGEPHTFTFRQSYSLSKSVWGAVGDTEDKIMDVVLGGISQGRDVREVSADLMGYLKGGPDIVKGRWGKLKPGEKVLKDGHWQYATEEARQYARRLGSRGVDYRAMRLYRSEIHRNQQEAAVEEGEDNPACTGEYDWILMPGRGVFLCDCPELADGGPYTKETIPDYPHPNCFPAGTMITMADGTEKPIEAIEKGDYVTGRDGSPQLVTETMTRQYMGNMVKINFDGNHTLILTPDHPVFTWNRRFENYIFIDANRVRKGALVATHFSGKENMKVSRKRICHNFSAPVYNMTTIPDHTYIANGIIVHNCDCMVEPRLKDSDDLIKDLKDYVNGVPSEGANEISLWTQEHGLGEEIGGLKEDLTQKPDDDIISYKSVSECKTFDEFRLYMKDRFNVSVDEQLRGLDVKAMTESAAGMEKVLSDFPELKNHFKGFLATSEDCIMATAADGSIKYNSLVYKSYKNVLHELNRNSFLVKGINVFGAGAHEAGHLAEVALVNRIPSLSERATAWKTYAEARRIVGEACNLARKTAEGRGLSDEVLKKNISGYAGTIDPECLAEAVGDYYLHGTKAQILSKMIYKLLKEIL